MKRIDACPACLRRSRLLERLASRIDKVCTDRPGKRTPELLALGNEDLVAATCRTDGDDILEEVLETTGLVLHAQPGRLARGPGADPLAVVQHLEHEVVAFDAADHHRPDVALALAYLQVE